MKNDTHGSNDEEWIGFDLDGTLAKYDGWKGIDHIGEPVESMVLLARLLHWLGKKIKILTARVAPRKGENDSDNARKRVAEARLEKGKGADRIKRFVWRLHLGNEASARAALHAGFSEQKFSKPHRFRQFVLSRKDIDSAKK